MDITTCKLRKEKIFVYMSPGQHSLLPCGDESLNLIYMNGPKVSRFSKGGDTIMIPPFSIILVGRDAKADISIPPEGHGVALYFDYVNRNCQTMVCSFLEENRTLLKHSYIDLCGTNCRTISHFSSHFRPLFAPTQVFLRRVIDIPGDGPLQVLAFLAVLVQSQSLGDVPRGVALLVVQAVPELVG